MERRTPTYIKSALEPLSQQPTPSQPHRDPRDLLLEMADPLEEMADRIHRLTMDGTGWEVDNYD